MNDVSTLVLAVDSRQVNSASAALDRMAKDGRNAETATERLQRSARRLGFALGAIAGAGAAALIAFTKSSINAADAASKAAQAAGLSTEAYTSLAYAARLSGVEQERLGQAFTRLNRLIQENDDSLTSLGIATRDIAGNARSADEVLGDLADRFAGMADGAQKSALAARIFGERVGPQLIPLLNQGRRGIEELRAEAERLGIVIDTETGRAAEQFNDNLTRLKTAFDGLVLTVAKTVLPVLVELTNALVDNIKQAGIFNGVLITAFEGAFGATSPLAVAKRRLQEVQSQIKETEQALAVLSERTSGSAARRAEAARERIIALREEAEKLRVAIKQQEEDAKRIALANKPRVPATTPTNTPNTPSGRDRISEADRYLESLRRQLQTTRDLTVEQRLLEDIEAGRLGRVTSAQQDALVGVARQIDAIRAQQAAEEELRRQQERAEAARQALAAEGEAVFRRTRTPAEELAATLTRLQELLDAGVISWDTYARAQDAAQDAFERTRDAATETANAMDQFAINAAENIQRELGEGLYQIMQGNFRNIADSFKQMLDRMVAEALAANIARKLFGELVQGGQGSGIAGGLLSRVGGFLFGGGRASGGPVSAGKLYRVNERGPEMLTMGGQQFLLMGKHGGRVDPVQSGGAPTNINVTVNAPPGMDRRSASQVGVEIGRKLQQYMARA